MQAQRYMGIITTMLLVLSAIMVIGIPQSQAADLNDPNIWGIVGLSDTEDVATGDGMEGVTVLLYKAFDLYDTEPVDEFLTLPGGGGFFQFDAPPGYYKLGVESKTAIDTFYHINSDVAICSTGVIVLPEAQYNDTIEQDIPLKAEAINAHFYGEISEDGVDVEDAEVIIENKTIGFMVTDTTDASGMYSIDVYNGTFDVMVSKNDIARYYGTMTVGDIADVNETFELDNTVLGVNYSVAGFAPEDMVVWYNGATSSISLSNTTNNDHIVVIYNYAVYETEDDITADYTDDGNVSLDPKIDTSTIVLYNGTDPSGVGAIQLNESEHYNITGLVLNITATLGDSVYMNYTLVEEETEDEGYIGRNTVDIDLSANKISGLISVVAGPPVTTNIDVMMYNKSNGDVYRTSVTSNYFEIYAPDGDYVIVVHPEGYAPFVDTTFAISSDEEVTHTYTTYTPTAMSETHIEFPANLWSEATITWTREFESYEALPGLGTDLLNIRLQIDHTYGNGDGNLTDIEVQEFEDDLEDDKHPELMTTDGFFLFDNNAYSAINTSYSVNVTIPNMVSGYTSVADTEPIAITFGLDYVSNDPIAQDEEEYPGELILDIDTGVYRISLLDLYANSYNPQTNVPVGVGVVDVVYNTSGPDGVFGQIPLTIKKISEPVAKIAISSSPLFSKLNATEYIVRNDTEVEFNGEGSFVLDGEIDQYYWNWGDGTNSGWTDEPIATHNFTSKPSGYTVTLTVLDTAGQENHTTLFLRSDGEAPSITGAIVDKTWVGQNEDIEFNASNANDGLVTEYENLSFEWNFGDGGSPSNLPVLERKYNMPGVYLVYLNISDEIGNIASTDVTIHVNDTTAPNAMVPTVTGVEEGELAVFNGSGSKDNEGDISNYTWTFGDTGGVKYGIEVNHTFTLAGLYNVTLNVTDEVGNTHESTRLISIEYGPTPTITIASITVDGTIVNGRETTVTVVVLNTGNADCTEPITVILKDGSTTIKSTTVAPLLVNGNGTATFKWTPDSKGDHELSVIAFSPEEQNGGMDDTGEYAVDDVQDVAVDPSTMERYGVALVLIVIIVAVLVLLLGRDKIAGVIASRPPKEPKASKKGKGEDSEE